MSEVNEILKKVTASIEEATDKFNARAEDALKEAKKSGKLSEETKAAVDKMASEFNALREAEKTLKAAIYAVTLSPSAGRTCLGRRKSTD